MLSTSGLGEDAVLLHSSIEALQKTLKGLPVHEAYIGQKTTVVETLLLLKE